MYNQKGIDCLLQFNKIINVISGLVTMVYKHYDKVSKYTKVSNEVYNVND